MRRIYFSWVIAVLGIFGTVYGAYLLIYHFNHGNGLSAFSLALLIIGIVCLSLSIPMWIISYINNKKMKEEAAPTPAKEESKKETVEQPKEEKKNQFKDKNQYTAAMFLYPMIKLTQAMSQLRFM